MPTYETPEPISLSFELGTADIHIVAGERTDTVVDVRPSNPDSKADVAAAEQTRVELVDGRLSVKAPKDWRRYTPRGGRESIDVEIALPSGSRVDGEAGVAELRSTGRLGELRYKAGAGGIRLDQTGPLTVQTGAGDVSVEQAEGAVEIKTGSGAIEVGGVDGPAKVRNANGNTWIGDVAGELRANAANGRIAVDRAGAAVQAKTANGDILLGAVGHGSVVAETAFGRVDIGVADGVPAWLDLNTKLGKVSNELDASDRPAPGDTAVEIRARTSFGDIAVHRAGAELAEARS
jgi:putative adhesin